MSWPRWVLDATMGEPFVFCPIEDDGSVVFGMNFIGDPPGEVVGVIHEGGQEAVEAFMAEHGDEVREIAARCKTRRSSKRSMGA